MYFDFRKNNILFYLYSPIDWILGIIHQRKGARFDQALFVTRDSS